MGWYTVKSGDSWAKIAGQKYGSQRWFQQLQKDNPHIGGVLKSGMKIWLPRYDTRGGGQAPLVETAASRDEEQPWQEGEIVWDWQVWKSFGFPSRAGERGWTQSVYPKAYGPRDWAESRQEGGTNIWMDRVRTVMDDYLAGRATGVGEAVTPTTPTAETETGRGAGAFVGTEQRAIDIAGMIQQGQRAARGRDAGPEAAAQVIDRGAEIDVRLGGELAAATGAAATLRRPRAPDMPLTGITGANLPAIRGLVDTISRVLGPTAMGAIMGETREGWESVMAGGMGEGALAQPTFEGPAVSTLSDELISMGSMRERETEIIGSVIDYYQGLHPDYPPEVAVLFAASTFDGLTTGQLNAIAQAYHNAEGKPDLDIRGIIDRLEKGDDGLWRTAEANENKFGYDVDAYRGWYWEPNTRMYDGVGYSGGGGRGRGNYAYNQMGLVNHRIRITA